MSPQPAYTRAALCSRRLVLQAPGSGANSRAVQHRRSSSWSSLNTAESGRPASWHAGDNQQVLPPTLQHEPAAQQGDTRTTLSGPLQQVDLLQPSPSATNPAAAKDSDDEGKSPAPTEEGAAFLSDEAALMFFAPLLHSRPVFS